MSVRFSRRASEQLNEILEYFERNGSHKAAVVAARIEAVLAQLARKPAIGRPTRAKGVRAFRVAPYPYLVFYRSGAADGEIMVLRLRHTSRRGDWREGH